MADTKITALTALTAADPINDVIPIVDVSDTSMAASGTTKKISVNNLLSSSPTASGALTVSGLVTAGSATISGDLTVDTNVLKVDTTNNRVGIGTATPGFPLDATGGFSNPIARFLRVGDYGEIIRIGRAGVSESASINYPTDGTLAINTVSSERFSINSTGICTWSNVGGVAGTAMTLNATGLGVGAVPSAWVTYKSISVGGIGACVFGLGTSQVGIAQGAFYNNTPGWAYSSNSQVPTHYLQIDGENRWYTAPSGTAGNTITFTQAMTLDASGNLLVGTTTAGAKITALAGASGQAAIFQQPAQNFWCVLAHNQATSGDNSFVLFGTEASFTSRGSITYNRAAGQVSYNITSDYRLKEDVKPLTGALNRISSLKPSTYKFKETGFTCEGFIAHELAEVIPAAVTGEKDAVNEDGSIKAQGVDLSKVVPILVAAIQELTARVQTLETR